MGTVGSIEQDSSGSPSVSGRLYVDVGSSVVQHDFPCSIPNPALSTAGSKPEIQEEAMLYREIATLHDEVRKQTQMSGGSHF